MGAVVDENLATKYDLEMVRHEIELVRREIELLRQDTMQF